MKIDEAKEALEEINWLKSLRLDAREAAEICGIKAISTFRNRVDIPPDSNGKYRFVDLIDWVMGNESNAEKAMREERQESLVERL